MKSVYVAIFVQLTFLQSVFAYQVRDGPLLKRRPPWMIVCHRSDPKLNECANTLFANIFPELAVGIPEMNVDKFEPLTLDSVTVAKGSGAITLAGGLYNLTVVGPSNATPTYTELDLEKMAWNFGIDIPLLDISSDYDLKGKILVLPLVGHGRCELKLWDVKTKTTTKVKFVKIEEREVMQIEQMHVAFTLSQMKVELFNLFNGNKILGQTVNNFLNVNGLEIVKELEESIGSSLARIFTQLMNNVFIKMPTDLWLLTDEQHKKYLAEKVKEVAAQPELSSILEKLKNATFSTTTDSNKS